MQNSILVSSEIKPIVLYNPHSVAPVSVSSLLWWMMTCKCSREALLRPISNTESLWYPLCQVPPVRHILLQRYCLALELFIFLIVFSTASFSVLGVTAFWFMFILCVLSAKHNSSMCCGNLYTKSRLCYYNLFTL